jgi:protein required for attachment to host cells
MINLESGTWIVVADGEKALFLENRGTGRAPDLVVCDTQAQDNPPDREQAADRPGRMNDGPSAQRSAMDETDWHTLEKHRFAAHIAELLYQPALDGRYDSLVLVADPRVLGELREHLHGEVRRRVIGEIPRVLTNHPTDELRSLVLRYLSDPN